MGAKTTLRAIWELKANIKHRSCKSKIEVSLNSMYNSIITLIFLLPLVAMLNLITNQSHFLITLLSLEGITLSLVLFVPLSLSVANAPNTSIRVVLLTFGACEARVGLSLIVLISRSFGTDILNSLTISKC